MAAADRTNNTEQLHRFINNLWQHQQKTDFCDFTLTTNNTSIECHKLVLSSASSYFSQLLGDHKHNINIIDVTPLPEHVLRTVVAFMYNSEYVINDDNVIELLKLSEIWSLDVLAKLCLTYMNNITINNACRFYNFALENVDQHKSQILNEFIRKHFTSLYESGQLSELTLKNFTTIIKHDEINVENEDVIFASAVQIINQQSSVEDINRCLELVRFPYASGDFLVNVIFDHPLMKEAPRNKYASDALLYRINKTSTPEVKPPRYWDGGIYYIGIDHCMYQCVSRARNNKCLKMKSIPEDLPGWVDRFSSMSSYRGRVVIVEGGNGGAGEKGALLLSMINNTQVTKLPNLPSLLSYTGVTLSNNEVYVIGNYCKWYGIRLESVNILLHLTLGGDSWQTKNGMFNPVHSPLVIRHQQHIYLLGGYNDSNVPQSSVSQYSIKDDKWKHCRNMPVPCNNGEAGVVVHEDRIKVITVDRCMMYADDTDTWTVQRYARLGNNVNAFIKCGQIWAVVLDSGVFRMASYNLEDNLWRVEHESIYKACSLKLFC